MALFRSTARPRAEDFALPQGLFYWRSQSGGEIDALAQATRSGQVVPVEVKYQAHISGRDLATLRRSFMQGILITVDAASVDGPYLQIPAAVFLWFLAGESAVGVVE